VSVEKVHVGQTDSPRFYTVSEAAKLLRTCSMTVYRAIQAGEFPAIKVRGRYVVPAKAIDALEASALANGLVVTSDFAVAEG
jgi:excisionase family DNA binding protein